MANLTFQQLEQLVAQAGGTPTQQEYLAGIAAGVESGGNPTAQNPTSTASGLWQELTTTWLGQGGGKFAPTAKQATPLQQAEIAVQQSVNGYQPWAPDFGGAYGAPGNAGNPQAPAPGSPVANYLKSIGVSSPGGYATGSPAPAGASLTALPGGSLDPLNWPGELGGAAASAGGGAIASALESVIGTITAPLKAFVVNGALVLLGIILLAVALVVIAHSAGGGGSSAPAAPPAPAPPAPRAPEEERPAPPAPHEAYQAGVSRGRAESSREPRQASSSSRSSRSSRGGGGEGHALEGEAERVPGAVADVAAVG